MIGAKFWFDGQHITVRNARQHVSAGRKVDITLAEFKDIYDCKYVPGEKVKFVDVYSEGTMIGTIHQVGEDNIKIGVQSIGVSLYTVFEDDILEIVT